MIDTSEYNFKLLLKKKSKHEKSINDYHMPSKLSPHLHSDHVATNINNNTPRKLKPYRLNKSSNDIISEPKASIDSFKSTSSLSSGLVNSNAISITNHFDTRHPPRKSSYLANLNLVLDSASKELADSQLPTWKSFYIKKMVEFGFNPYDEHHHQQFRSRSDNAINKLDETTRSEIDFRKSIKRLKANQLERTASTRLANDNQKSELASSQSKSYYDFSNQKNKSATKFFSPSLIILPELDETVANTNASYKDNLNTSNFDNLEHEQDNFNLFSDSSVFQSKMSRQMSANKTGRSELTLPPIVETKVNNFTKKSNSSRVDSGIAVEYENHGGGGGGGGWHQSSNASENGAENVITTIEVVEPNSLKKNGTSSTLNSYGKASSIQSKTSVTNNTNSSKPGNNKQIKASLSPANEADDTSKLIKQPNTPKIDSLSRQNTLTTINNHENLPLVNKQNLNQNVSPTQQQQQKPVPKPRLNNTNNNNNNVNNANNSTNNNKRALSLQRQNTQMPTENSQFLKENNQATQDKKLLKRESTNLGSTKPVIPAQNANNVGSVRPKTGTANNRTVVTFNINPEQENNKNLKIEQEQDTSKALGQTPSTLIKPSEFDIIKYNEETENVLAALNLMEHDDQAMNDFTMARIMKWLEEVENCHNMMQPPSAWSNNQNGADRSTQKRNSEIAEIKANFMNNEYCLSDYDSLDEQIIEYNRVVDKTYHIVHDED